MSKTEPENNAGFKVCVIRSDPKETFVPKKAILKELKRCHFREEATFAIKLALEEALCNAIKHGNQNDRSKTVTVRYAISNEKAVITVRDQGRGFAPDKIPDPTTPDRLPLPRGRGIMLIRAYMDEVAYRDDGRELFFAKHRVSTKPSN